MVGSVDGRNPLRHRFETKGVHCLLVFPGESSVQGFLGGAGYLTPDEAEPLVDFDWGELFPLC